MSLNVDTTADPARSRTDPMCPGAMNVNPMALTDADLGSRWRRGGEVDDGDARKREHPHDGNRGGAGSARSVPQALSPKHGTARVGRSSVVVKGFL